MYHAMMNYYFKPECMEDGFQKWRSGVAHIIGKQPGFIRVQFYEGADGHALAIGTWESEKDAENFMKTGVFANLLESFDGMLADKPYGRPYKLRYFEEAK